MARSYYSTIFEQSADDVWNVIRDFNNYPIWVDGAGESRIEAGRAGDSVGAIRNVLYNGTRRRQKLLALSDADRSQTYAFAGEAPIPARNFQATLRVTPVVEGNRAFVEWWATFDCEPDRCEERIAFFREAFAGWLESLRRHLNPRVSEEDATRCSGSSPGHTV
jgi:Polyketide cyclase / dehydrase and lipid transport